MQLRDHNGVNYLTFDLLSKAGVKHGFSTRVGGVSQGCYESLNLGFRRGDSRENVLENYRRIGEALGMDYTRMCLSQQTHTTNIRIIEEADAGNGILRELPYTDVDGMITKVKNLPLVTHFADCVPLFFYDPVQQVVATSHSGWRGTVGKIGKVTVERMQEAFGCKPEDILCGIGPSICKHCYEVSGDVAEEFRQHFSKEVCDSILQKSTQHPENPDKYMLDLWEACRQNFLEAGILPEHIEVTDFCTKCHPELFYSHRIMGNERGSLAAFISL